jgi:predicted enzyme related to lactoylglutathione lyase
LQSLIQGTLYVLAVRGHETSTAFYTDRLRFGIHEIGGPGWRMFVRDGWIVAGQCPDAIPAAELGYHSCFGYFVTDDIDDYEQTVAARGVKVIKPLGDGSWGMRAPGRSTLDR